MNFEHIPVLLSETINGLNIDKDGIYVDGTIGGAGHSKEILKLLDKGKLIGIDQDINAVKKAKKETKNYKDKITLVNDNFKNLKNILKELDIKKVDGILLDLGVSSHQLDTAERGFSYRYDSKLDMRMNPNSDLSAWDVVNKYSEDELTRIIKEYGEDNWAKRIASFICTERNKNPINTTFDLVTVIKKAIPKGARKKGPHPAKRTFQAIRIEVNEELDILKNSIISACNCLRRNGRLCIITFHSLEDRIVKNTYKYLNSRCICPKEYPICKCDKKRQLKIINKKPIIPTSVELKENSRSRSAKLRIGERV